MRTRLQNAKFMANDLLQSPGVTEDPDVNSCARRMLDRYQDLQIRPQAQRLQILELLNDLMLKHRNALKELGNESIVGITDLVSGEKDPRNLMVIFSILRVVMVEWDIPGHAEVCLISVGYGTPLIPSRCYSIRCSATSLLPFDRPQMILTGLLHRTSKAA